MRPLRSSSFLKRRKAAPSGSRSWTRIRRGIISPSKGNFPFLQLFGNALDGLVGPCPFLLQRSRVEDFVSTVVHAQQGVAIGPAKVALIKSKGIIAHVLSGLSLEN